MALPTNQVQSLLPKQQQTLDKSAKPFVKWAGGKTQLLDKFCTLYPIELFKDEIDTYIEPFVGGGAVLFFVLQNYRVNQAVIIDENTELINCYRCIRDNISKLIQCLYSIELAYKQLSMQQKEQMFLQMRKDFNNNIHSYTSKLKFEQASRFIFLNKTSFNGLYRVNSQGLYNVPFGKHSNPTICDSDNLMIVNELLQKVEIVQGNYSQCVQYTKGRSFIYFDPPYRPLSTTQNFTKYGKNGFDDEQQKALAKLYKQLDSSHCKLMLSNSDPKNINPQDMFFDSLYSAFDIQRLDAKRMINCKGDKRGNISELVIRNYS